MTDEELLKTAEEFLEKSNKIATAINDRHLNALRSIAATNLIIAKRLLEEDQRETKFTSMIYADSNVQLWLQDHPGIKIISCAINHEQNIIKIFYQDGKKEE